LKKTINGRQPGKKQTEKETTLEKTINGRQPGKKNKQTMRQSWKKQWIGRQPSKTRTRRKPWAKTRNHPKMNGE
jgi:hypothetical protein